MVRRLQEKLEAIDKYFFLLLIVYLIDVVKKKKLDR
jgi:hypothetical protein